MNKKEFEQEVLSGINILESLEKGIEQNNLKLDVSINFKLAKQYLNILTNQSLTNESLYYLTRTFHHLGIIQGKIDAYRARQNNN